MSNLREMLDELAVIPEALEGAALVEDAERFTSLRMRNLVLRSMIREAELEPYRHAVETLEKEVLDLEAERQRALSAEPPAVPAHIRHTTTPQMLKGQAVEGALRRSAGASRDLSEARKRLRAAEEGAARVVVV